MNMLEHYLHRYAELGWSIIPISPRDKKPLVKWQKYQTTRASAKQLQDWAKRWPSASIAVVTGKLSGVFVIDQDSAEGQAFASALPETATVQTQKGRHYYFKMPEGGKVPGVKVRFSPGLDLRGEGGYAILPPSVHPDGHWYAWDIPPEEGIAVCPPEVLRTLMAVHGQVENTPYGAWRLAIDGAELGERNMSLASLAGRLLRDNDPDMAPLLLDAVKYWNSTKNPQPMTDEEVTTTFNSILNKELEKRSRTEPVGGNLRDLQKLKIAPRVWTIPGLLPEGCFLAVGKAKTGKTLLFQNIGLRVARPECPHLASTCPTIDFTVNHGHVLYLLLEDDLGLFQESLLKMLPDQSEWPADFEYFTKFPSLYEGGISELERKLRPDTRLVVIDTLAAFLVGKRSGSKNNVLAEQYEMIAPIRDLAHRKHIPIVVVTHQRKGRVVGGDYMDAISGTLALPAAADGIFVMDKPKPKLPKAKLFVQGRGMAIDLYDLELNVSRLEWTFVGRDDSV